MVHTGTTIPEDLSEVSTFSSALWEVLAWLRDDDSGLLEDDEGSGALVKI